MNPLRPKKPRLKLGGKVYKELRNQVLARDGWRCQSCGSPKNLQVHHLRPRSKLGDDVAQNLISLCASCHARRHGSRLVD
jgi:5-methylcytosine-specific restriction endonuclease McrA